MFGCLSGVEIAWNLKSDTLFLKRGEWVCSRIYLNLNLGKSIEHYPLFMEKVLKWFGGRNGVDSSEKGEARKVTKWEA